MEDKNVVVYPDINGVVWPTPDQAIRSNQCSEDDMSRGSSGGCTQDADSIPNK